MKMLNGNVLVEIQEQELEKTQSGILVPTKAKSYNVAKIIEPDSDNELETGSTVYIPKHSGSEVEIEGKKYVIVNKREIILIL